MSNTWRVRANETTSGWCWDVSKLRFFAVDGEHALTPIAAIASGSASDSGAFSGYEPEQAVMADRSGFWGGRADRDHQFWIGVKFDAPVDVSSVTFDEGDTHRAKGKRLDEPTAFLECQASDGSWILVRAIEHAWPAEVPDVPKANAWRVRADLGTNSGWAWDVRSLRFFCDDSVIPPSKAIASGSASDDGVHLGYDASVAVLDNGQWGGRKDSGDTLWIGAEFARLVQVTRVCFCEPGPQHSAKHAVLEWRSEAGVWSLLREVSDSEREEDHDLLSVLPAKGEPPCVEHLVCASSKPLTGSVPDVSLQAALHEPRLDFTPDADFYLAENCEGVWVCASKAVGHEVLRRACDLVRATLPEWQRKLWGRFASPRHCKDPGPMRIIILDNRSDEQAGCIPELNEGNHGGRNGTSCPFVFTSREDFDGGVGNWHLGSLTAHEMCHGADMVLRQLHDPSFHQDVATLYAEHREFFRWQKAQGTGRTVTKNCYACANRDEFLAETHTILLGMMTNRKDYCSACISKPEQLEDKCPAVTALLRAHFNYPSEW